MKRLAWLLLLLPSLAQAGVVWIDGGCKHNGNGKFETCATAPNLDGARNTWVRASDGTPEDPIIYTFVGAHDGRHGSEYADSTIHECGAADSPALDCDGNTWDGRYFTDGYQVHGVDWAIFQPKGWTGNGTGQFVLISSALTSTTWTPCDWDEIGLNCDCGLVTNITDLGDGGQTACEETWVTVVTPAKCSLNPINGPYPGVALKPDGSATYVVGSFAAMDNSTAGYVNTRCTNSAFPELSFLPCHNTTDCPSGETCTATSNEVDSFFHCASEQIFVRFGGAADSDCTDQRCAPTNFKSYRFEMGNGVGIGALNNFNTPSSNITVRGLKFGPGRRSAIQLDLSSNIVVQDNLVAWRIDHDGGGSDRSLTFVRTSPLSVIDNHVCCGGSEAIHTNAMNSPGITAHTIQRNFIRDMASETTGGPAWNGNHFIGPGHNGTPECMTIGGAQVGDGDYADSDISNNVCLRIGKQGIQLENDVNNARVHDNIFWQIGVSAVKINCLSNTSNSNNNKFYNNLIYDPGLTSAFSAIQLINEPTPSGAECEISGNLIYNNTVVMENSLTGTSALEWRSSGTGATRTLLNNIFRNNIFACGDKQCVEWVNQNATNKFENNVLHTTAGTAAQWRNVNYDCATVETDCGGNCPGSKCDSAADYLKFRSPTDFHITPTSPARDAGVSKKVCTGGTNHGAPCPLGDECTGDGECVGLGTTDINNTLAGAWGLGNYSDNDSCAGVCDMGADEIPPTIAFASSANGTATTAGNMQFDIDPGAGDGLVCVVTITGASELVTLFSYEGVTVPEIALSPLVLDAGELGTVQAFVLPGNLPPGDPLATISVTKSGTTETMQTTCVTADVTNGSATSIVNTNNSILSSGQANPSVSLDIDSPDNNTLVFMGFISGQDAVASITPFANWSEVLEQDFGTTTAGFYLYDINGFVDVTAGWTQTTDDAVALIITLRGEVVCLTCTPRGIIVTGQ